MAFWDGDIFSKAFAGALVHMTVTSGKATRDMTVLLQKLCKKCPHPEKLQS
jgi:hypothetical protein